VTGVSWPGVELIAKRFQLVHELLPSIQTAALLINPRNVEARSQPIDPQERARSFGLQVFTVTASDEAGIDAAFAELEQRRPGALVIGTDPFFSNQARRIVAHATRLSLPTVYDNRDYVVAGGLVSYGNSIPNAYRRAGVYVGRILHGAKPGSLPIDLASEFEVVINLKTAATLGIQVPASVLVLANEVLD
jgi:putative tryptophan/tyrosine transport system substrate-binding protein